MNIAPIDFADFNLVEVKTTPHCQKHGAMNKTTADGIWRCLTVSGFERVNNNNATGKVHKENICRAGCQEVKAMRHINFADHLEKQIAQCLHDNGIEFVHESENKAQGLDFYLPKQDIYIEVKQYHTPRISTQMEQHDNIIAVQGVKAVKVLIQFISR